jgi:hypothetical protein
MDQMPGENLTEGGQPRVLDATHETVSFDGLQYDVVLIDRGGEFVGSWRCPLCNRGDASPLRYREQATIRLWAHHCLEVHHLLVHEKAVTRKPS